jgi:TRAP-type mannitol/chloroaromatic compound transport system permease small subunit
MVHAITLLLMMNHIDRLVFSWQKYRLCKPTNYLIRHQLKWLTRCILAANLLLLLEGVLLVLRRVLPVYYSQKYKNNEYNTGLEMGKGI